MQWHPVRLLAWNGNSSAIGGCPANQTKPATRLALCCLCSAASAVQLREAVTEDQARLSAQAGQLEAWQSQLGEQQARLEELEATAAEALAEARDAAAAALQERDQVGLGRVADASGCRQA